MSQDAVLGLLTDSVRFNKPKTGVFVCPPAGMANGKWHIESRHPTQAKGRLEWGTQHLLPA